MNSVQIVFIGIFVVLVFAQAVILTLKSKELQLRVQSWWGIAILFALALNMSTHVGVLIFSFVSFLAFKEYLSLIPTRRADRRVIFWAYLAIIIQAYWIWTEWYGMFIIFIPVYVFLFLPLRSVLIGETKGFLNSVSTIQWGLMTTVFSVGHMSYLLSFRQGAGLVLFLVLLTELNDVFQFLWGKSFGRHKIIPKVSPNKTIEGFLGGVASTTALSFGLAPYLTPFSREDSIWIGMTIAVLGFFGDVTISALKRDIGVKDSGSSLPGHGGILDRLDSLTYTAPVFFHIVRYFYHG